MSIFGGVTTALGALPIVSGLLPDKWSLYLFPPLGKIWHLVALVLVGLLTLVIYHCKDLPFTQSKRGRPRVIGGTLFVAVLGACLFLGTTHLFVREVDIPSIGSNVVVTVGFTRTQFANATFPGATDWQLLRQRSTSEEEIRKLWTPVSLFLARLSLFTSYMMFLLPAAATASLGVLFDVLGAPPAP